MPSVETVPSSEGPGWHRIASRTAGITGAALAAQLPAALLLGWPMAASDFAVLLGNHIIDFGGVGWVVALTLHVVEGAPPWRHRWRHAILAAGLVAAVATQFKPGTGSEFNRPEGDERLLQAGLNTEASTLRLHQVWFSAILACVSALYLLQRRESMDAEQRGKLLESQGQQARRRVRILRETAGAARLDPQVLFNCLGLARSEYLRDPHSADALLDRLIDFLRGSLSATRAGPHTLGAEVDQALRFAAILTEAGGVRLIDAVPPELRHLDVSPGLLLPLVQQWLAACCPSASVTGGSRLCIAASMEGETQRMLCVHLDGPAGVPEDLVVESRHRVTDLYASQAAVHAELIGRGAPRLSIRFELPLDLPHAH